ncbi:helix-turn-helix transcriptional regulator [Curtobacterium sp. MCPF17_002]|uniref:helix-turn-helix transcriptional regulator n=1 Tax=Curtobacterium sp. MCPF17_002 TaxID=2175645 RepID=UPI000DAAADE5|nr:helix-turn-helix transcriptional regulator [Curtobacterium sp. MCPF17_002]WIB78143.1 helix-turn-helix transcriptional regulator [Curtobacterium sp. MCPF17_002]
MTPAGPAFEYVTGGDDDVALHRIRTPGPQSGTIGPRPDHVVFVLADGHATLTADDGSEWSVAAGRPMMLSASVAYAFDTDATAMTLLHVAPSVLGDADEPSEFVQPDHDDPGVEPLLALLGEVADRILDPSLDAGERAALNRRVTTVVLSTFTRSRSDVEHRLRRAIRFVHDHAGESIEVADIAAGADLSERGLQDLFRRRLAVTPMRYLREVRLDRVHLELVSPRGGVRTVRDVAHRWQFTHLGRFAEHYRRRFGERPHESMRRTDPTHD